MAEVKDIRNSFERYLDKKLEDPEFRKLYEKDREKLARKIKREFDKRNPKTS
ncbi:MAG: hypothetical protein HYX22_02035 [Candidatus Yanofskybacteria bacterium]|nr:hypothetical protein [Candidatus Yanofskybacteria bacterium]